jgi:two-component system cell cycle sensor histidine kinase/response regulator CckA
VVFAIGAILSLHVIVLASTKAPLGQSIASQILQSLSVLLACILAGRAALRSRDFARIFWAFSSAGFALLIVALVLRHFEHTEGFGASDYLFLLHMAPFGLMLLLNERSRPVKAARWPLLLDYIQILIVIVVLFIAFIYVPSKGATPAYVHSLYATFAGVLITRNITVTGGFWFRSLIANSERERWSFRAMAIYLLLYTTGSALTHYVFLHVGPPSVWIELEGSVPFLAGAWLFSRCWNLPVSAESRTPRFHEALSLHLIPAVLPLVVAAYAIWIAKSTPRLAWVAVGSSLGIFALRLLATTYSEYQANEAAKEGEVRYRSLALATTQIIWTTNAQGEVVTDQPMWAAFSGMSQQDIRCLGWMEALHPDDREPTSTAWRTAVQNRTPYDGEYRLRRHDGAYRHMAVRGVPVPGEGYAVREWVGTCTDITERKRAEEALYRREEEYRAFFDLNVAGNYISTPEGVLLACNPAFLRMFGFASEEEAQKTNLAALYPSPDSRQHIMQQLRQRGHLDHCEKELRRKDGRPLHVTESSIATFGRGGELVEIHGFLMDETERRKTEEQLRQAQKMEAVGQLAGGIAHDFNNVLSIINGYSEILLSNPGIEEATQRRIREILKAGQRAAALTRQLLAFSRKQILQPKVLGLNLVLEDLDKMLRRLIGDDIEIRTVLDPDLGPVKADPSQMEQVILNFCINARDAMPEGGRITIETANVELDEMQAAEHFPMKPGRYIRMAVSDTGTGMDQETLSHVFEPFFTTKGPENGTGLGLATVYGIVRQSGGHVWAHSEPGRGATFSVYLPTAAEEAEPREQEVKPPEIARGSETILLVEDVDPLRVMLRELLERSGYTVLEAEDGERAIQVAEEYAGNIALLLTDVSLPKIQGPAVATSLMLRRSGMKVLYISGYTDNAIVHSGVLKRDAAFLQKPFTVKELTRKLREILDTPQDHVSHSSFAA